MKILADGSQVTSRSFYFLLDFNDRNYKKIMSGLWGIMRLQELNKKQYLYLFKTAIDMEYKLLGDGQQ